MPSLANVIKGLWRVTMGSFSSGRSVRALRSLLFVAPFTNTLYAPAEAPLKQQTALMQKSLAVSAGVTPHREDVQLPLCSRSEG